MDDWKDKLQDILSGMGGQPQKAMDMSVTVERPQSDLTPIQQELNTLLSRDKGFSLGVSSPFDSHKKEPGIMYQTRFADGGEVPPLPELMSSLNQTPNTNYDFYKNLSAEDRAALQARLSQNATSPGNLVAQGAAGIGDAVARSFGGQNTSFQKDVMTNNDAQEKKALDAFDTNRTQKLQDTQANIMAQENDPNSSLSTQTRDLFTQMGIKVPSGMNHAQLKTLAPSLADLVKGKWEQSFREASLRQQNDLQNQGLAIRKEESQAKTDEEKRANLKEVASHYIMHPMAAREAANQLAQNALGPDNPPAIPIGQTFSHPSGAKITRTK